MITGYLRVSTGKQNPANQQDEIRRFAESRNWIVDHWVTEVASGRKNERDRKLGGSAASHETGDTLIVTEISRLSRTLTDVMAIMGKCLKKRINLFTTKEGYTFDNSINSKVLCFAFRLVAEIERNLISMRTKEALALRRAEGMVLGRRKGSYTKYNVLIENRAAVIRMLGQGVFDHAYLQFLRAVARYVRQVPAQLSVDSAGRSGKKEARRKRLLSKSFGGASGTGGE